MSDFFNRLEQIRKYKKIGSINQFATQLLGYKSSEKINRLKNEGNKPSMNIINDILKAVPEVNSAWLLTGEGDMLVNQSVTPPENKTDYLTSRRNQKLAVNNFLVPLIPVKAQAGFLRAIDQTVYIDGLDKYALPPGIDPYGAIWAYWEVQGDSMEPTFYDGDYILATQVPRMDWDQLRKFYTYIIVTEDKILIKRVYPKTDQEWALISDNEERYPQQLLKVETVKQVWVFRRHIDSKAPPPKKFEITV